MSLSIRIPEPSILPVPNSYQLVASSTLWYKVDFINTVSQCDQIAHNSQGFPEQHQQQQQQKPATNASPSYKGLPQWHIQG